MGSPYGLSLMSPLGQGNKKVGGEVGEGEGGEGEREGGEGEGEGGERGERAKIVISKETEGLGSWLCALSLRVYTPHHKSIRSKNLLIMHMMV